MNRKGDRRSLSGRLILYAACIALCLLNTAPLLAATTLYFDSAGKQLSARPAIQAPDTSVAANLRVLPGVRYDYYMVSGRNFSEIIRSVEENAPRDRATNKKMYCRAEWSIGLSFDYDFRYTIDEENAKLHAAVEFSDVSVANFSRITLPWLFDDSGLNPAEKKFWSEYLNSLAENCHEVIAVVRDPETSGKAKQLLAETDYFIVEHHEAADPEKTIEALISSEAAKSGRELALDTAKRIASKRNLQGKGKGIKP